MTSTNESEIIKTREISFIDFHPDPVQAESAAKILSGIEGILEVRVDDPMLLEIRYNVLSISLQQIEEGLTECGFHLSGRLIHKLKRALYYYTEEVQRDTFEHEGYKINKTHKIFIHDHSSRDHGITDTRPDHWREYR